MPREIIMILHIPFAVVVLLAATQTDPRLQVEQLAPETLARRPVAQVPQPAPATPVGQLTDPGRKLDPSTPQLAPRARTDPGLGQLAAPGQARAPTRQLSRRDRDPRVPAVPPWMVDACEEAAAGRRPPPPSIDCATVLEARAVTEADRPSAEETLLASPEQQAQRQAAARSGLSQTPDADEIARRLGAGDVQNAPVAQAVGAAFSAPQRPEPPARAPETPLPDGFGFGGGDGFPIVINPRGG